MVARRRPAQQKKCVQSTARHRPRAKVYRRPNLLRPFRPRRGTPFHRASPRAGAAAGPSPGSMTPPGRFRSFRPLAGSIAPTVRRRSPSDRRRRLACGVGRGADANRYSVACGRRRCGGEVPVRATRGALRCGALGCRNARDLGGLTRGSPAPVGLSPLDHAAYLRPSSGKLDHAAGDSRCGRSCRWGPASGRRPSRGRRPSARRPPFFSPLTVCPDHHSVLAWPLSSAVMLPRSPA